MIKTTGLRKSFRSGKSTVEAVRGVDLDVGPGEIFGFLGPNGAGKTTTLRMLATLIRPDGGTALVAGVDLMREPGEVRRRIGYVAQDGGTWGEVTAREELVYQGRLHRLSPAESRRRAVAAIEAFQLTEFADRTCKTYSGGQRRRVDIALGVVHRPGLVFLDEPTTGLDPQSRAHMWTEVRRLRDEGATVFLTTHYLEEADALCDRVAIIDHGAIVAVDSPAALKSQVAGDVITLNLTGAPAGHPASAPATGHPASAPTSPPTGHPASAPAGHPTSARATGHPTTGPTKELAAALAHQPYVRDLEQTDTGLRLVVDAGSTAIPQVLRCVDSAGVPLFSIELHRPSLDDVFLARTGRSLRDTAAA